MSGKKKETKAKDVLKNPHSLVFEKTKKDDGTYFRVGLHSAATTSGYKLIEFNEPSVVEKFSFDEKEGVATFMLPKGVRGVRLRFEYTTEKDGQKFYHVRFEYLEP